MSFIDSNPPKHLDIGSLVSGENTTIYNSKQSNKKYKYNLYFSIDEVRALAKLGEKPVFSIHTNSREVYEKALEMQKRANRHLGNIEPEEVSEIEK